MWVQCAHESDVNADMDEMRINKINITKKEQQVNSREWERKLNRKKVKWIKWKKTQTYMKWGVGVACEILSVIWASLIFKA